MTNKSLYRQELEERMRLNNESSDMEKGPIYQKSLEIWRLYKQGTISGTEFRDTCKAMREAAEKETKQFDPSNPF